MFRSLKWATPFVAMALLVGISQVRAEETKKETGTVTGTVTDQDGKAVANAEVRLMAPKAKGEKSEAKADKAASGERPKPIATGKTDADGKFELKDVAVGSYTLAAGVKGVGQAREQIEVKAGDNSPVALKIKPAAPKGDKAKSEGGEKHEKKAE